MDFLASFPEKLYFCSKNIFCGMNGIEERYISLVTDFGFKRIFGTAPNKDLLINFLNSLFDGRKVIKSLKYSNSEHVGDIYTERKAIFDVYCESGTARSLLSRCRTHRRNSSRTDQCIILHSPFVSKHPRATPGTTS